MMFHVLWLNFILGLNCISFCFCVWYYKMYDNDMIMGLKQEKIKFKPRIQLNHNMYMVTTVSYMYTVI